MKRSILPSEFGKAGSSLNSPSAGASKKTSPKGTTRRARATNREQNQSTESIVQPSFYEMHVERVNIIENIAATKTIYSPEYIAEMNAEPRPGDKFLGKR